MFKTQQRIENTLNLMHILPSKRWAQLYIITKKYSKEKGPLGKPQDSAVLLRDDGQDGGLVGSWLHHLNVYSAEYQKDFKKKRNLYTTNKHNIVHNIKESQFTAWGC